MSSITHTWLAVLAVVLTIGPAHGFSPFVPRNAIPPAIHSHGRSVAGTKTTNVVAMLSSPRDEDWGPGAQFLDRPSTSAADDYMAGLKRGRDSQAQEQRPQAVSPEEKARALQEAIERQRRITGGNVPSTVMQEGESSSGGSMFRRLQQYAQGGVPPPRPPPRREEPPPRRSNEEQEQSWGRDGINQREPGSPVQVPEPRRVNENPSMQDPAEAIMSPQSSYQRMLSKAQRKQETPGGGYSGGGDYGTQYDRPPPAQSEQGPPPQRAPDSRPRTYTKEEKEQAMNEAIERQQRMMAKARGFDMDVLDGPGAARERAKTRAEMERRAGGYVPSTGAADAYMANLVKGTKKYMQEMQEKLQNEPRGPRPSESWEQNYKEGDEPVPVANTAEEYMLGLKGIPAVVRKNPYLEQEKAAAQPPPGFISLFTEAPKPPPPPKSYMEQLAEARARKSGGGASQQPTQAQPEAQAPQPVAQQATPPMQAAPVAPAPVAPAPPAKSYNELLEEARAQQRAKVEQEFPGAVERAAASEAPKEYPRPKAQGVPSAGAPAAGYNGDDGLVGYAERLAGAKAAIQGAQYVEPSQEYPRPKAQGAPRADTSGGEDPPANSYAALLARAKAERSGAQPKATSPVQTEPRPKAQGHLNREEATPPSFGGPLEGTEEQITDVLNLLSLRQKDGLNAGQVVALRLALTSVRDLLRQETYGTPAAGESEQYTRPKATGVPKTSLTEGEWEEGQFARPKATGTPKGGYERPKVLGGSQAQAQASSEQFERPKATGVRAGQVAVQQEERPKATGVRTTSPAGERPKATGVRGGEAERLEKAAQVAEALQWPSEPEEGVAPREGPGGRPRAQKLPSPEVRGGLPSQEALQFPLGGNGEGAGVGARAQESDEAVLKKWETPSPVGGAQLGGGSQGERPKATKGTTYGPAALLDPDQKGLLRRCHTLLLAHLHQDLQGGELASLEEALQQALGIVQAQVASTKAAAQSKPAGVPGAPTKFSDLVAAKQQQIEQDQDWDAPPAPTPAARDGAQSVASLLGQMEIATKAREESGDARPADAATPMSGAELKQNLTKAMGYLIKHRGGSGFGRGRLTGQEAKDMVDQLLLVQEELKAEFQRSGDQE